ncbi:MAG TPA: hypothetical protein VFN92_08935 [Solirubrobacterales bacterium]|nr:hypothetical protein [Solirubrobacterales bacterium]
MRAARNVAILMLLALLVAFLPNGENVADALLTALTMALLAGLSWMLYTLSRQNQLTLATLSDGRRAIFYGAFGLIALLIAGADYMFATGGGSVLWILLFAAAAAAIWRVWIEANSLG